MPTTSENVATNVANLRALAGLSLTELHERCRAAGGKVHRSALHRVEHGKQKVDVDDLVPLSAALGVPLPVLLGDPADALDHYVREHVTDPGDATRRMREVVLRERRTERQAHDEQR